MSSGVFRKLNKARTVARAAGGQLVTLQARFGDQLSTEELARLKRTINECYQQASALGVSLAANALEAERMHKRRQQNIKENGQ